MRTSSINYYSCEENMFRILSYILVLFCILPSLALSDTGVFFGAGNQVIPIKNNDIQLVKENVVIKLRIDEESAKWGIPFFPRADVEGEFLLKNTRNQQINIEVGFPFLDLQGFGDEKLVLSKLDFRVKDMDAESRVTLKEGVIEPKLDPKGVFKKVFVWREQFGPQQTKKLTVKYRLLLGVSSANSIMRGFQGDEWKYFDLDRLFPALSYNFIYITKTAYTWKEPVEKAVFSIDCSDFFQRIDEANFMKGFTEGFPTGISRPVFLYDINPSNFARDKSTFRWEFKAKVPEDGIGAGFIILFIPSLSNELQPFLSGLEKTAAGKTGKREYITTLASYYSRILKKDPMNENAFTRKYFEPIQWLKGQLIFEKDQKSIATTLDRLKALTTGSSGSAENAPAPH